MSSRPGLAVSSVAIGTAVLICSSTAPSFASSIRPSHAFAAATALPITSFTDIVVDDANDHLFLSQGLGSTQIAVVDFTGASTGTIAASEAAGIALSPDGSTLYAALRGADSIGMYDVDTLAPVGDPMDAGGQLNGELEIVGGSVWFGYEGGGCPEPPGPYLGSMPIGGGSVTQHEGGDFPLGGPVLAASPSADILAVSYPSCAGQVFSTWSASTDPPTLLAGPEAIFGFPWGFELSPNGATLLLSDSSRVDTFRTSDLEKRALSYDPWPAGATSMATTTANGGWLATADRPNPSPGPAVALFDLGGGRLPEGKYIGGDHTICHDGLAFTADAGTLFAIECAEGAISLLSIDRPARFDARLTIHAEKPVQAFERVRITARLPAYDTNDVLRIEQTPLDKGTSVLLQRAVNASGNLVTTVRLTRQTAFVVRYAGDDGYLPDVARVIVRVRAVVTADMVQPYARSSGYALYHDEVRYRADVRPLKPGRKVYVLIQAPIDGRWREVAAVHLRLDLKSILRVKMTRFPHGRYRIRTTYAADRYNVQGTSAWDLFRITG